MREIKFRAYDKIDLVMYYNVGLSLIGVQIYKEEEQQMPPETILLDRGRDCFELMQYTGLKDKNGKEIYEGDIIIGSTSFEDYNDERNWTIKKPCVVEWRECYSGHYPFSLNARRRCDVVDIEVIGNIYENPELLNTPTESV